MNSASTKSARESAAGTQRVRDLWILALLLAFPSTGFIQKYTGMAGVTAYVAGVIGLVFLTAHATRRISPWLSRHFRGIAVLAVAMLAAGFVVLHPFEDGRGPGKSSDRDEGLEMAVTRLAAGETPYYPSNWIAGPLSVLPGSILLASPFVALGNSGYQNVFWLAAFLFAAAKFLRDRAAALWLLAVPLALSVAAQYEFVSGGDLIANGIFIAVFFLFALTAWDSTTSPAWQRWAACLLVGVGLASRANFLLLYPLFGAALWRLAGMRKAVLMGSITCLTTAAIILPFYLHDPTGFTPLGSRNKLASMDHALPWASTAIIAVTILSAMAASLWLLMQRRTEVRVAFFRGCTMVTLVPMLGAVLVSSFIGGHPDFGIMKDRFGLMYVFFALLGWGGALSMKARNDGMRKR
jgi:hypothetical protein